MKNDNAPSVDGAPEKQPRAARWWRLVGRLGLSSAVVSCNVQKITIGFAWRAKPRAVWIELPAVSIYWPLGSECPDCKGQGGWSIEAGDGCWFDECETCEGKGVVSPNNPVSHGRSAAEDVAL